MKLAIVLPDGAADEPVAAWESHAARSGQIPTCTAWPRLVCRVGSGPFPRIHRRHRCRDPRAVCYDPHQYYSGRAPLEALAKGLSARPDQSSSAAISSPSRWPHERLHGRTHHASRGDALIAALNQALRARVRFLFRVSYRNLMFLAEAEKVRSVRTAHDIPDQPVSAHVAGGEGAERVLGLMDQARAMLAKHSVNEKRRQSGHDLVTDIWLWGQGRPCHAVFSVALRAQGAAITGVDIVPHCHGYGLFAHTRAWCHGLHRHGLCGKAVRPWKRSRTLISGGHIEAPDEAATKAT